MGLVYILFQQVDHDRGASLLTLGRLWYPRKNPPGRLYSPPVSTIVLDVAQAMMARAMSSCLPALFLLFCFYFRSISSVHVHSAVSPSFDHNFSHPTAILISPEAASISPSARPGRSRAHSTGRRVSYAKRVPPWESTTGEMVSFAPNFSFQIIPGLYCSSCAGDVMPFYFTPTMPHGHGQNLGFLPSQNSTMDWCWYRGHRLACFSPEIDVRSTEDTETTWPSNQSVVTSKMAPGLGSASRYLHTERDRRVVHGDVKPANVMLDASGNAKLGDFGRARLVDHGAEPQTTQVVAGTVGYIDPELVNGRRPSAESDVYSFSVVLLEIACGRRPTSRGPGQASVALLASVREMYRRSLILDAADWRLGGEFDRLQMELLLVTGLWCAHHDPVRRPSATQTVDVLRSEDARLPVLEVVRGSREIHSLEGRQAYGDLPAEDSAYLHESTETGYLSAAED